MKKSLYLKKKKVRKKINLVYRNSDLSNEWHVKQIPNKFVGKLDL